MCLMRANRLEWNHEKCACDQQGSNAFVMVFSFKLSTETRDMRRSQIKPGVHCFAGGRFMLPWMTQNDSHIVLTFFFSYPREPFALDFHRHLPILKYGTVCMTNFQPAAPPCPRRSQGSPPQSEGFANWHLWRVMTRDDANKSQDWPVKNHRSNRWKFMFLETNLHKKNAQGKHIFLETTVFKSFKYEVKF